jgi:tripartite-type tricarboxylate transporter receptor subunit TctC
MKLPRLIASTAIAAAAIVVGLPGTASAQYPDREVRWVIPWNAGGSNDIMARFLQPILAKQGVKVVVENVAGGTGAIGMGQVATARPDGYTVGMGTSSTLAIIAQGKTPLKNEQFTHLVRISVDPLLLVVPGKSNIKTLDEFMAHMKANPGKVTIGTPGSYNINHIFAVMTGRGAGVPFRHVSYPGGSRVVAELMGQQIEGGVLKPSETMEQIKSGDLRPLGVFANNRLEVLPDVPTFKDRGIDVYPFGPMVQMAYLAAPANLDPKVRETLTTKFKAALQSPEFKKFAAENGFLVDPISGAELDAEIRNVAKAIATVAEQTFPKN